MSERIEKALAFVNKVCEDKTRDDNLTPAIVHPIGTMMNMIQIANVKDEDLICAALLHDCLEDAPSWINPNEFINSVFGGRVYGIVYEVTLPYHVTPDAKTEFMVRLMRKGSPEAILVKLCDRLDNLRSAYCWKFERHERYIIQTEKMLEVLGERNLDRRESQIDSAAQALYDEVEKFRWLHPIP